MIKRYALRKVRGWIKHYSDGINDFGWCNSEFTDHVSVGQAKQFTLCLSTTKPRDGDEDYWVLSKPRDAFWYMDDPNDSSPWLATFDGWLSHQFPGKTRLYGWFEL